MGTRELLLNVAILAGIVMLAYFVVTLEPESHITVYSADAIDKINESMRRGEMFDTPGPITIDVETQYGPGPQPVAVQGAIAQQFPTFFNQALFSPLIPTPTPTPVPTPTPTPPADLSQAVEHWQFQFIDGNNAYFHDPQAGQDFSLAVGQGRNIQWGRYNLYVVLESVDNNNFSATVTFEGQRRTFNF